MWGSSQDHQVSGNVTGASAGKRVVDRDQSSSCLPDRSLEIVRPARRRFCDFHTNFMRDIFS